jgi:hypothetical protein
MPDQRSCAPFDPSLCPILQGLPREEQERLMQTDPMIRACIEMHFAQSEDTAGLPAGSCCQAGKESADPVTPAVEPNHASAGQARTGGRRAASA